MEQLANGNILVRNTPTSPQAPCPVTARHRYLPVPKVTLLDLNMMKSRAGDAMCIMQP